MLPTPPADAAAEKPASRALGNRAASSAGGRRPLSAPPALTNCNHSRAPIHFALD
jgi:hypothetical protein